jgi:hypothetical protein
MMLLLQQLIHLFFQSVGFILMGLFMLFMDMVIYDLIKQAISTKKIVQYLNTQTSSIFHGALMKINKNNY